MAYLNLGIALAAAGRFDESLDVYRHCRSLDIGGLKDPKAQESAKVNCLFNWGRQLAERGEHQAAIGVYDEAIQSLPAHYAPQSLFNLLGLSLLHLGRLDEAERWFRRTLELKSDHVPAFLTYASLLARKGDKEAAESLFRRAIALAGDDAAVHEHFGWLGFFFQRKS